MKKKMFHKNLFLFAGAVAALICLIRIPAHAVDLAVLPYAVETVSRDFTADDGSEYAKLIALGARVEKNIGVYSFREMEKDIARLALDPQGKISKEDLSLFCKSRYLQYAVIGRVSKTDGGYSARGVLYSAARNEVVARSSAKGRTIAECAARETDELFSRFSDAVMKNEGKKTKDLVILLDSSYTVTPDWKDIYRGLTALTSGLIDGSPDTDIHLIPYADAFKAYGSYPSIGSVPAMKEALDSLKKRGSGSGKAFGAALSFALDNISWRPESDRTLLVIANSPVEDTSLDRYGTRARKKRVKIHTVILGNVSGRDAELYRRLSRMTGGVSSDVSYRQIVYDKKGDEYYLYMSGGRLFEGDGRTDAWKDGVLRIADHGSRYVETPQYADEVAVRGGAKVTPYTMGDYYRRSGSRSLLNTGELASNVYECINSVSEKGISSVGRGNGKGKASRVLLSHNGVSVWVDVLSEGDLDFFRRQKELGFVFPLGVRISLKEDEPFGMTFNPSMFVTGIAWDDLPSAVRVDLGTMVKNPAAHVRSGFLKPPLYFVNVMVDEIDERGKRGDVRGD